VGRHRWKAERTIAWLAGCRRLRMRYDRGSERFFAFAMLGCARFVLQPAAGCGGRWATRLDGMNSDLQVGSSGRFQGVYHRHWEWSRFELAVPSRWFPRNRRVLCELVPGAAPLPAALAVPAGVTTPPPGLRSR